MNLERLAIFLTLVAISRTFVNARPAKRHNKKNTGLKKARIDAIKSDILNKLGMSDVPKIKSVNTTIEQKRKMIQLYKKSLENTNGRFHELYSDVEFTAKKFHYFTGESIEENQVQSKNRSSENNGIYFSLHIRQPQNDANKELIVHSAKLKIYKSAVRAENLIHSSNIAKKIAVNIYQVLQPPSRRNGGKALRRLIDSKAVDLNYEEWEYFDIKEAVESWINNPNTNYGIHIESDGQNIKEVLTLSQEEIYGEDISPGLTVLTSEKLILGRNRRHLEKQDCVQGDGEKKCCRFPLYISFADIGWDDWIVAPEGYNAFYCNGKCPHRYKLATTFAGIKSLLRITNRGAAPSPCCTATKLSPLPLLHYDKDGDLVVTEYSDMIVEECKCA